jgi:hypothetical protein
MESQLSTANNPTATIVIAINECSLLQMAMRRCGGGMLAGLKKTAITDCTQPMKISSVAQRPNSRLESPCALADSTSRSTSRKRNWR